VRIELNRKINPKNQTAGNHIPHFGETGYIEHRNLYEGDTSLKWMMWQHDDVGYEEGTTTSVGEALMQIEEKFGNGWHLNSR
jgi:hypothetical protein